MLGIEELFNQSLEEIVNSSSTFAFELGSDHLISERDQEELQLLFNLARLSIEHPGDNNNETKILTSDLRKVSAAELEKVLVATEKAISTPIISLKALKVTNANRISKILLASDEKEGPNLFQARAKKSKPAQAFARIFSFFVDLSVILSLTAATSFILCEYYFTEIKLVPNSLSLASLALALFFLNLISYPVFFLCFFRSTLGMMLSKVRIISEDGGRITASQAFIRSVTVPLSLLTLSFLNAFSSQESIHDILARTKLVR